MFKKIVFLFLLVGTSAIFYGQRNPTKIYGTALIDDNISMKMTEVTILEWMCFIANNGFDNSLFPDSRKISTTSKVLFDDLRKAKDFEYLKLIRYSGIMKERFGSIGIQTSKNFKKFLQTDTSDLSTNIPISGITYKQALQFCKWKEDQINSSDTIKVRVTLPSTDIYKKVITDKDSINAKKCNLFNYINCHCFNKVHPKENKYQGKSLLRADAYWPTDLGFYNLQGNAAELTNEEGIAMGGSYKHYARQSYKDMKQEYTSAEEWLGFRYIVTLK